MKELINPVEDIAKGKDFILRPSGAFHNGINIETHGPVKSIAKGKVIAYRFSKDYIALGINEDTYIMESHFHWLGNDFWKDKNLIEGENQNNNYKTYFEKIENQEGCYKLKEGLSEFDKIEAYYYLRRLISNSFVLMEYELPQLNQDKIKFYMLYNHLAPFGRMTSKQKLELAWFSKQKLSLDNAVYTYVTTEEGTILPSELKLKTVSKVKDDIYKISWNYCPGLPAGTGTIKESLIRIDLREKETRRAYRKGIDPESKEAVCLAASDKKTAEGIIIYTNEKVGARNVKAIVSKDTEFDCEINDLIKAYDTTFKDKDNKDISFCPLKVNCDGIEGFIYLNETQEYKTKKEWEKDINQFYEVINKNKPVPFNSFKLNLKFRETKNGKQIKIEEDKICFPEDLEIDEGEIIGYSGFNFMKEDTVGNGNAVVSDNDIRDFIIHIETFFENDEKLKFDYFKDGKLKEADLLKPFFLIVNAETQLVNKKPECKLTKATESYDGCIAKVEKGFGFYDNEEFYKLTIYANALVVNSNYFIINDYSKWNYVGRNDPGCRNWYSIPKDVNVSVYNEKANSLNKTISLKAGYIYHVDDGRGTDKDKGWGKDGGEAPKELRHIDCTYEILPQSKIYYIKSADYSKMINKITENRWLTEKDQKDLVWIKDRLDSSNLYSKIEKSEGETETVAAEIKLEPTSEEIIEYATEERKEESAVWINAKDNEGKSYWVKKSDIKTEKGGTPVELVSYYDWNKLFDKIELKDNKKYIVCKPEKLEKKDKFSARFNRFDRQRKIQRLADCGIGEDFANRLLDGKEGNFFFTHVNEWSNESKQVTDIQLLTDDPDKIKDSFENFEFFKEIKEKNNFPKQDVFCYIHPNYFLKNLRKLVTIPEFNPYEGMTYASLYSGSPAEVFDRTKSANSDSEKAANKCKLPDSWKVESNPGFTTEPSIDEKRFTDGKCKGYGKVTGLFNEDYLKTIRSKKDGIEIPYSVTRSYYYHIGVDFSGKEGDPIISLIHGKVLAKCWITSNGRCLLVQGKTTNNLYMLCHLSAYADNLEVDDEIVPGQEVAKVGGSGGDDGYYSETAFAHPHLHVSVIYFPKANAVVSEILDKAIVITIDKKKKEKRRNWNFNDKTNFSRQYLDPLNYSFEGGWFNDLGDREALENAYVESKKPKEK